MNLGATGNQGDARKLTLSPIGKTAATHITGRYQQVTPTGAGKHGRSIWQPLKSSKSKFSMIVLDACRNNPIKSTGRGKLKGLASVDAPAGSLIMYATKAGDVALDGTVKTRPLYHRLC